MKEKLTYIKNEINKGLNEFKKGTIIMFKEFFNKNTNKKQRANMWTFLRLIIPVFVFFCSLSAITLVSNGLYILTTLLVGFGAITDYFDGKCARKYQSTSEYGKLLDQVADKFFAGTIGLNLLLINPTYIVTLLGEVLIASVNVYFKLKHNKLSISSSFIGRIKEWPLFITLGLGFLSPISLNLATAANISIVITAIFQLLTACSYIKNNNEIISNYVDDDNIKNTKTNNYEKDEKIKEKELILIKENKTTQEKLEELKVFKNTLVEQSEEEKELSNIEFQKIKTL